MKVILRQDHDLLGDAGHILEVKDGYARNFLIPRGIASVANAANTKSVEEVKRQKGKKMLKLIEDAQKLKTELEKHTIEIKVKTGEDNKMFGSVTNQMIEDGMEKIGFAAIDKRKLTVKEPIKALGNHTAEIKLAQGVVANLKLKVVSEDGNSANENSDSSEEASNVAANENSNAGSKETSKEDSKNNEASTENNSDAAESTVTHEENA